MSDHETGPHSEEAPEGGLLAPILSELIRDLGMARERAARAETQNEFLREQVQALRSERNLLRGRLIQAHVERDALPAGLTEDDAERLALESDGATQAPPPRPQVTQAAPARPAGAAAEPARSAPAAPPPPPGNRAIFSEGRPARAQAEPSPKDLWARSARNDSIVTAVGDDDPVVPTEPAAPEKRRWWRRRARD